MKYLFFYALPAVCDKLNENIRLFTKDCCFLLGEIPYFKRTIAVWNGRMRNAFRSGRDR
jgi:hypothetical protein